MAVSKRLNGTWRVQIVYAHEIDPKSGKPKRKSYTRDTKEEAEELERREYERLRRLEEQHIRPSLIPLKDLIAECLRHKQARGELRPKTLANYVDLNRRLIEPYLGSTAVDGLTVRQLQQWQDMLAPTPDTPGAAQADSAHRMLRSVLSWAVDQEMLLRNPAKHVHTAYKGNPREGFTLQEAYALEAAAEGERLAPLFSFLLWSGLRHGEALGLRWDKVDERGFVLVDWQRTVVSGKMVEGPPKNKAGVRRFKLLPEALEALRAQKALQARDRLRAGEAWENGDYVFTTRTGGGRDENKDNDVFRRIRDEANTRACQAARTDPKTTRLIPELPIHSLRHATASVLLAATAVGGIPQEGVCAKYMGHTQHEFHERYAHLLDEATEAVAAAAHAFLQANPPTTPVPVAAGRRGRVPGA